MKQVAVGIPGYAGVWDGGLAASFNGASHYQSDDAVAQAAPMSLELWVWLYSWNGATNSMLDWDGATVGQIFVLMDPTQKVRLQAGGINVIAPAILPTHAWHHIVGTYTGGVPTLWIDGVNVAAGAGGAAPGGPRTWNLGNDVTNGSPLNGLLASPAVYNFALSGAQIAAHRAAANDMTLFPAFIGNTGTVGAAGLPTSSVSSTLSALQGGTFRTFPPP
jgi:hypothetical protein